MATNARYFEVSRIRGIVTIATVLRLEHLDPLDTPSLREIVALLPNWHLIDGDRIEFKEIK